MFFFFSSRRRHTRSDRDWSSDVCSSDLALRILRSTEEAEEVVQDTFVEIWRRAADYRPERGTPGAWIAAMARSRAIDRLRERTRSENTLRSLASEPPRDPDPPPSESAARREERTRVRAALAAALALDALDPDERAMARAHLAEPIPHEGCAEALGRAEAAARLLSGALTPTHPPDRVWRWIEARISARAPRRRWATV